jgi:hypothetical protein
MSTTLAYVTAEDALDALAGRHAPWTSVITVSATTDEGGTIVFAGDARPMMPMLEAAIDQGEVTVAVEGWQVLSRKESL